MTEQRDSSEPNVEQTPPAATPSSQSAGSPPINPYQAPAYHSEEAGSQTGRQSAFGLPFAIMATLLFVIGLVMTIFTKGLALPVLVGVIGGAIRAWVIFPRQSASENRLSSVQLLMTSTFVTLVLLVSCTIAFAVVCTGGVLAFSLITTRLFGYWSAVCGVVALAAFTYLFVLSMKWKA